MLLACVPDVNMEMLNTAIQLYHSERQQRGLALSSTLAPISSEQDLIDALLEPRAAHQAALTLCSGSSVIGLEGTGPVCHKSPPRN